MNIFIYDTISLDCLRKEIFHRNLQKSKKYILKISYPDIKINGGNK